MQLNLKRPLVFFDLESTGLDIANDRIIEIGLLKVFPNGTTESKTFRINPTIPISKESMRIHGITNEDVANEPTFKELGEIIFQFFKDADIAGYNSNKFDIPLLAEEFLRIGIEFDLSEIKQIDVQTIFHKMEARTLSAAYKFYCQKTLENAHSAEADTFATYQILMAQLDRYENIEYQDSNGTVSKPVINEVEALDKFTTIRKYVDLAGFIGYNDKGEETFSFGKNKGITVKEIFTTTPAYIDWILNADFPNYTKMVLRKLRQQLIVEKNTPKDVTLTDLEKLKEKFMNKK